MTCTVSISTPQGKPVAKAECMPIQKACDQTLDWLRQGLNVELSMSDSVSPFLRPVDEKFS